MASAILKTFTVFKLKSFKGNSRDKGTLAAPEQLIQTSISLFLKTNQVIYSHNLDKNKIYSFLALTPFLYAH